MVVAAGSDFDVDEVVVAVDASAVVVLEAADFSAGFLAAKVFGDKSLIPSVAKLVIVTIDCTQLIVYGDEGDVSHEADATVPLN